MDEFIILVEGIHDVCLREEQRLVGPGHTISISSDTPHGFVVAGQVPARTYMFLLTLGAYANITCLEEDAAAGEAALTGN